MTWTIDSSDSLLPAPRPEASPRKVGRGALYLPSGFIGLGYRRAGPGRRGRTVGEVSPGG
jgi:hypothetical protein